MMKDFYKIKRTDNSKIFLYKNKIDELSNSIQQFKNKYDQTMNDDIRKIIDERLNDCYVMQYIRPLPSYPQMNNTCYFDAALNIISSVVSVRNDCIRTLDTERDEYVKILKRLIKERFTVAAYDENNYKTIIDHITTGNHPAFGLKGYGEYQHVSLALREIYTILNIDRNTIILFDDENIRFNHAPLYILHSFYTYENPALPGYSRVAWIYFKTSVKKSQRIIPQKLNNTSFEFNYGSCHITICIENKSLTVFENNKPRPCSYDGENMYCTASFAMDIDFNDRQCPVTIYEWNNSGHYIVYFPVHNVLLESFCTQQPNTFHIPADSKMFKYTVVVQPDYLLMPTCALYLKNKPENKPKN